MTPQRLHAEPLVKKYKSENSSNKGDDIVHASWRHEGENMNKARLGEPGRGVIQFEIVVSIEMTYSVDPRKIALRSRGDDDRSP